MIPCTSKIAALAFTITVTYSATSWAQSLTPTVGSIGIFTYTAQMPKTWNSSSTAFDRARETLAKDKVQLEPVFAYEGPKGNLLFGTWKELRPGVAFTVTQLNSDPPQFPEDWGVLSANINSFTGSVESGIEYSGFSVMGPGDGKTFGKGKPTKTYGVWFDLPISYQDAKGTYSGLASIYYRATEAESTSASAGVKFTQNLLNNLKLSPGVNRISAEEYKSAYVKNSTSSKVPSQSQVQPQPQVNQAIVKSSERTLSNNESISIISKLNLDNLVGILHNDKGVMYCVNYGAITQAPCSLAQIGSNKAEINPVVIQQLNRIAVQK